jgi:hypothetical protein
MYKAMNYNSTILKNSNKKKNNVKYIESFDTTSTMIYSSSKITDKNMTREYTDFRKKDLLVSLEPGFEYTEKLIGNVVSIGAKHGARVKVETVHVGSEVRNWTTKRDATYCVFQLAPSILLVRRYFGQVHAQTEAVLFHDINVSLKYDRNAFTGSFVIPRSEHTHLV